MSAQSTIAENEHGAPKGFVRRWLYSTNHKDIGTMYIIFAIIAAFIGGGFSVFMRMELMQPGIQYMSDGHMWNVFTTCLLYTSPSPRDRTRSRMPSSA